MDAGPVKVTVFLIVAPLGRGAESVADRPGFRPAADPAPQLLIVGGAWPASSAPRSTAVVRDYWVLLALVATTLTALAGSLFPQTFAYARQVLERDDPDRARARHQRLRTVFSLAWVAGPPLAAFLLGGRRLRLGLRRRRR